MTIETATGRQFKIVWAGVSTLDGALRFDVKSKSLAEMMNIFSDNAETSMLKVIVDSMSQPQIYTGYTDLVSVAKDTDSTIVVALKQQ